MKARQADQTLAVKLGFERRDSHHRIYRLYLDGQLVARTFISHGQRELDAFLIGQMARQMCLSRQEFLDAIACPLDRDGYYALLRQRLAP